MIPCVRSGVCALLVLAVVGRAEAEPVTHQFTGQISSFGGSLNLSSLFSLGDPVTMVAFTVGSWSGGSAPASSGATVTNNAPSPGQPGVFYDQWYWNAQGVSAPVLGTVHLSTISSTLDHIEGTVFDSGAIPRVFPALGVFDGKTATFLMIDFSTFQSGYFFVTLAGVTTPAQGTSWGGIKALYRQ
jgi:hypothetical protein